MESFIFRYKLLHLLGLLFYRHDHNVTFLGRRYIFLQYLAIKSLTMMGQADADVQYFKMYIITGQNKTTTRQNRSFWADEDI